MHLLISFQFTCLETGKISKLKVGRRSLAHTYRVSSLKDQDSKVMTSQIFNIEGPGCVMRAALDISIC